MRNLRLLSESHRNVRSTDASSNPITWLSVGPSGVFCGGSYDFYTILDIADQIDHQSIPPESSHVVGTEFLVAENVLFLATSEGSLVLCWTSDTSVVCQIPAGISAFKWSPDQEILVVTTNPEHEGGHLLLLTADWMPVVTEPLNSEEFGEQKPVTVGWGKKETQFHGSEGKDAAKQKSQLTKLVSDRDDLRPRISWRGDGQFFCVSTVNSTTRARVIRIYDRQGILQGTSESVNGLEWSLAWQPSGSLIASTVELPQRREVVFFERNGLRHGSFTLPFPVSQSIVKEMSWNSTSEIILVWSVVTSEHGAVTDVVQLWTTGNYRWYLKQTFRYPRDETALTLAAVAWSGTEPYKLYLVNGGGRLSVLDWTWDVCRSTDPSSTVAVIDGNKVLLTSFALASVPPPSCSFTLQFNTFINHVLFHSTATAYELAVVTDTRLLHIFSSSKNPSTFEAPILHKTCNLPFSGFAVLFWCGKEQLVAIEVSTIENKSAWGLWTFSIHDETQRELESLPSMEMLEEDKNCKLVSYFGSPVYHFSAFAGCGWICLKNGEIIKADLRIAESGRIARFLAIPSGCDKTTFDHSSSSDEPVIYALNTASRKLYRNSVQLNDACTSFLLTPDFLLYTTHHHKLVAIPTKTTDNSNSGVDERQVERGSRLVTTVTNQTAVVLQLPRGNLEIIHPRSLVVEKITQFLRGKKYSSAFNLMRQHRVNMNLLVDFDVEGLMKDIPLFVQQIGNATDLNIFIAELSDENVAVTVYRNHFPAGNRLPATVTGKKNRVLEALERVLESIPGNDFMLSRLACMIYRKPQDLEKALFKVMELMKSSSISDAESALKFILYSTNVDELYNVTLGTYDFDLVLMVAAKSRKDPKEYIPFLNLFRALQPAAQQKYAIDMHLKRFGSALTHLTSMGPEKFPQCLELIVAHQLYREALVIFQEQSEARNQVLCAYGDFLSKTRRKYREAAIMYDEGGQVTDAVENYRKSLDWQNAMTCAMRAKWDPKALTKAADLMALSLKTANRHSEAAKVLLDFAQNASGSYLTLLEGRLWSDAYLHLHSHDCGPDARDKFATAVKDTAHVIQLQIGEIMEKVEKHQARLKIVRQNKREKKFSGGGDDFIDNMSETSSVSGRSSSRSSKVSRTSSKNSRKVEKKKRSLREGGPYEDLALLDSIKSCYRQTETLLSDIIHLLKFLLIFRKIEIGKELQREFSALISHLRQKKAEIWTVEDLNAVLSGRMNVHTFGPDATTSSIVSGIINQSNGELNSGDFSLSDLTLFVPPEFHTSTAWNDAIIEQFE